MTLAEIKSRIAQATEHERATGALRGKLAEELTGLKRVLVLEGPEPLDAMMAFITGYIESVPGSISLVTAVSKRLGFYDYAAPFLAMAEDYFLHPPEDVASTQGLEPLLDEAFLAHRLLEEVNDQHIRHLQRPLLPIDMTEANIIAHHLLGDTLATRLEQLVALLYLGDDAFYVGCECIAYEHDQGNATVVAATGRFADSVGKSPAVRTARTEDLNDLHVSPSRRALSNGSAPARNRRARP